MLFRSASVWETISSPSVLGIASEHRRRMPARMSRTGTTRRPRDCCGGAEATPVVPKRGLMSPQNPSSRPHLVLTDFPPSGGPCPSLLETLTYQALVLIRAHNDGHPDVAVLLRGHGLASASEEIHGASLALEQAHALVAKEHGFKDWDEVLRNGSFAIDARFEAATGSPAWHRSTRWHLRKRSARRHTGYDQAARSGRRGHNLIGA